MHSEATQLAPDLSAEVNDSDIKVSDFGLAKQSKVCRELKKVAAESSVISGPFSGDLHHI